MSTLVKPPLVKDMTQDWIQSFSKDRKEPAWLTELRIEAFEQYQAMPFPNNKSERWKRTGLNQLQWDTLEFKPTVQLDLNSNSSFSAELKALKSSDNEAQFFWDSNQGYFRQTPSELKDLGVQWLTLEEAITQKPDQIQAAWKKGIERAQNNKFQSLVMALGNGGYCLFVPPHQQVPFPLQHYISGGSKQTAQFSLNFLFLGDGSESQIWEEGVGQSANDSSFSASYTSINLGDNARVGHYYLQHWNSEKIHFQFQDIFQRANSQFNAVALALGGKIFHNESTIDLAGAGAENKVLGVLFGEQEQNFENWVIQNHLAKQTTSDIQYRGALKDKSKSFFSGMVSIIKEAQQSDAYQSAKSLLLSEGARADAIPNLEILADDVKCSHGAAVGPVDPDQKYYLQTRGVDPDAAEEIIIQGFVEPVIAAVPNESVQERLRGFIEAKMEK